MINELTFKFVVMIILYLTFKNKFILNNGFNNSLNTNRKLKKLIYLILMLNIIMILKFIIINNYLMMFVGLILLYDVIKLWKQ